MSRSIAYLVPGTVPGTGLLVTYANTDYSLLVLVLPVQYYGGCTVVGHGHGCHGPQLYGRSMNVSRIF